jgi:hypothetical protein
MQTNSTKTPSYIHTYVPMRKSNPKIWATFVTLKKCPKIINRPKNANIRQSGTDVMITIFCDF